MVYKISNNKTKLFFLLFITVFISLFSFQTVKASANIDHVQDLADILTDEEEETLANECISAGDLSKIDILILTTNSVPENRKLYLEDFYDKHDDVLTDATLILVNMDKENRGVQIQGYGQCEFFVSDDRVELILDKITPQLSEGNYFEAFSQYIDEVAYYMSIEAGSDYVHTEQDNLNYNENYYQEENVEVTTLDYIIFNLFVASIVGAVGVLVIFLFTLISTTTSSANGTTYINPKNSRVLGHWDKYIRTTTKRRPKPKDDDDDRSSGGGGGVSSEGHSHSGGGRSF